MLFSNGSSFIYLLCSTAAFLIQNDSVGAFQLSRLPDASRMKRPLIDLKLGRSALSSSFGADLQTREIAETLDWSFVDGVYLITCPNADKDGERIGQAKNILNDVGLDNRVQVKEFDTDDENRIRGCYTSHISVMKDILNAETSQRTSKSNGPFGDFLAVFNKNPVEPVVDENDDFVALVIEDNLALSDGNIRQAKIDSIKEFCASSSDWDMVHLSYIPYVPDLKVSKTDKENIVKLSCGVGSALGTTAYVINKKAMRKILEHDKEKGFYAPIPDVMAELFPESRYALHPTLFVRAPKTRSLVNPQLDDLRSVLFQPPVAAFAQSLLVATGLTTNALLPLVVIFLLVASAASAFVTLDSLFTLATTGTLNVPIFLPLISSVFSVFFLAVIIQGAMLAPKQTS